MKTYEQLRQLKIEDFLPPNRILCYGGGGAFESIAPYLFRCGIQISGVIDAHKRGSITISDKNIPYYNISEAESRFGKDATIIITIANFNIIQQVEQDLIRAGFCEDRIFDLNVWTWLTIPSEKSFCKDLTGRFELLRNSLVACCYAGEYAFFQNEWFLEGQSVEQSIQNFLEKRKYYLEESLHGRIPAYCKGCIYLSDDRQDNKEKIYFIGFGDHSYCNCDCVYCTDACSVNVSLGTTTQERYENFFSTIESLYNENLLQKDTTFMLTGGEISINPKKQQLYDVIKKVENARVHILSNCMIYDQNIADILEKYSQSLLTCDLDAGTPETYIKVKGFNKFDTVVDNLKKYVQHGHVDLKYIILPGWNTSDADFEGTVNILKQLGLKKLILSPEFKSYASMGNDRMAQRDLLFSTAKLVSLLRLNAIEAKFDVPDWREHDIAIINRLARELKDCYQNMVEKGEDKL